MRRVVVTGIGGITALGDNWPAIRARLERGETAIRYMQDWERYDGINTRLAAPIIGFSVTDRYPRKKTRTMGQVAGMAVYATERALGDAGLTDDPVIQT
ncbi:MAG TPA: beta-ketoacyl synthase N-terminal-like domain-containing protein, partial [Dongiaceae bacterium]